MVDKFDDFVNLTIINFWHSLDKHLTETQLTKNYFRLKKEIVNYMKDERTIQYGLELMSNLIVLCAETRDCRGILGGKGLKDVSFWLYFRLLEDFPETMLNLLTMFIDYGSWKDYQRLYEMASMKQTEYERYTNKPIYVYNRLKQEILELWANQLKYDYRKLREHKLEDISYCAKYVPKEKKALDKKYGVYNKIAKLVFGNSPTRKKDLRIMYSKLNKVLETTEIKMCNNKFSEIKMREVPIKCIQKYKKAFKYERNNMIRGNEKDRLICRANYLNYRMFKNHVDESKLIYDSKPVKTLDFLELMNDNRYMYIYDVIKDTGEKMFQHLHYDSTYN